MVPAIPKEKWKALYEAALKFRDLKIWDSMKDADIFGIVNPDRDETGYACIMGNLGELRGMALYLGKKGLKSYHELMRNAEMDDSSDDLFNQDCLMVAFEKKSMLTPEDRQLVKGIGMKEASAEWNKKGGWPQFRRYEPGYYPWFLKEEEVAFLTVALLQAIEMAAEFKKNPTLFNSPEPNSDLLLHRQPLVMEGKMVSWVNEWRKPENIIEFRPLRAMADKKKARHLTRDLSQKESYWLFEHFYWPSAIQDNPDDRPYFPMALLLFDLESQLIISCDLAGGADFIDKIGELIEGTFRTQEFIPTHFIVSNMKNYHLLRELCTAWKVELHVDDQLDILDEVKAELLGNRKEGTGPS